MLNKFKLIVIHEPILFLLISSGFFRSLLASLTFSTCTVAACSSSFLSASNQFLARCTDVQPAKMCFIQLREKVFGGEEEAAQVEMTRNPTLAESQRQISTASKRHFSYFSYSKNTSMVFSLITKKKKKSHFRITSNFDAQDQPEYHLN